MNFKDYFKSVLLEQVPGGPSLQGKSNTTPSGVPRVDRPRYEDSTNGIDPFLDDDTDPDQFLTDGIKQTFDAVQTHFNTKMTEFADSLSPENISTLSLGELRKSIGDVFKFVNKIQIYSKGKIEQISEDPYAIMAAFLASEPTKMAAFEDLHSNLDEFQTSIQEVESGLASLKGQIDDFVADVEQIDAEDAASSMDQSMQQNQPAQGGAGLPSQNRTPAGAGMGV